MKKKHRVNAKEPNIQVDIQNKIIKTYKQQLQKRKVAPFYKVMQINLPPVSKCSLIYLRLENPGWQAISMHHTPPHNKIVNQILSSTPPTKMLSHQYKNPSTEWIITNKHWFLHKLSQIYSFSLLQKYSRYCFVLSVHSPFNHHCQHFCHHSKTIQLHHPLLSSFPLRPTRGKGSTLL